jgi:hypothetical protein
MTPNDIIWPIATIVLVVFFLGGIAIICIAKD